MKKSKLFTALLVTGFILGSYETQVKADASDGTPDELNSDLTVTFIPDTGTTDPTDPNNPNPENPIEPLDPENPDP